MLEEALRVQNEHLAKQKPGDLRLRLTGKLLASPADHLRRAVEVMDELSKEGRPLVEPEDVELVSVVLRAARRAPDDLAGQRGKLRRAVEAILNLLPREAAGELEVEHDHVVRDDTVAVLEDPAPGTWYVATTSEANWTFYFSTTVDLEAAPEPEPDVGTDATSDTGSPDDVGLDAGAPEDPDAGSDPEPEQEAGSGPSGSGGGVAGVRQLDESCGCTTGRAPAPWRWLTALVRRR